MLRAALAALFVVAVLAVAGAVTSEAHANLARSEPAANSVVPTSPAQVVMEFTEPPDLHFSSWVIYDATASQVATGPFQSLNGSDTTLFFVPPQLANGTFTVAYRVLSTVDGHVSQSTLSFSVGAPSTGVAPTVPTDAFGSSGPPKALSVFSRWLTFISMTMAVGVVVFVPAVLIPGLVRRPLESGAVEALRAVIGRFFVATIVLLAVAAVLALLMQAWRNTGSFGDGISNLGNILTDSRFGHTWIARAFLIAGLAELALISRSGLRLDARALPTWGLLAVVALAIPVTQSLNSHAAAGADFTVLATAADWLHMVGAGAWIGGLVVLVMLLSVIRAALAEGERGRLLATLIPRFSAVAIAAVSAIVVTGVFQWALRIGNIDDTLNSGYGQGIIAKTVLLLPMLALGAANLLIISPRFRDLASRAEAPLDPLRLLGARFRSSVALEVTLGASILLATAFVTDTSPPAGNVAAPEPGINQEQKVNDLDILLVVLPGTVGQNQVFIELEDTRGAKEPVSQVLVTFTYKDENLGETELAAELQPDGRYMVTGQQMSLPGTWEISLTILRSGASDATPAFEIEISPA
ncbi:MAG: CopD family protein [Dehalococcoidia bacterium]